MVQALRQSTATIVEVGPFVDKTDGLTLEESITVTNLAVSMFKHTDVLPADGITNGGFGSDTGWTKGTNWQITGNVASQTSPTASDLSQTPATALIENQVYVVVYTVANRTTGAIVVKIGGTSGTSRTTNATFTEIIVAGSGSLIEFTADGTWDGDIDDVTLEVSHLGITPAASGSSNDMVFADGGTYYFELSAVDAGILGRFKLVIEDVSDILPRTHEFMILPANVYDSLYGSDKLQVDVTQMGGDTQSQVDLKDFADAGYNPSDNKVQGVVLVDTTTTNTDQRGTDSVVLAGPTKTEMDTAHGLLATEAKQDTIDGIVDDILVDTGTTIPDILKGLVLENGTIGATGNTTTKLHLVGLTYGNNEINGWTLVVFDNSTSEYHQCLVTDWVLSTALATVEVSDGAVLPFTPEASVDKYWLVTPATTNNIWDRILNGSNHNVAGSAGRRLRGIQEFQGYEGGAVWIDTNDGTAGTTDFENGTVENPVDSIADALTISASLSLKIFQIAPGSSITLGATFANKQMRGHEWTLDLSGEDIAGSEFDGANVSGIGTGSSGAEFQDCFMGATTIPAGTHLINCDWEGDITLGAAGTFYFENCTHGSASPSVLDFGGALNSSVVHMHPFHGAFEIKNMGAGTGTYVLHLNGDGALTINSNCSATSTVNMAGNWTVANNASGITINEVARFDITRILSDSTAFPGASVTEVRMAALTDWIDGGRLDALLDALIATVGAAGAGLTALAEIIFDEDMSAHQSAGSFGKAIGDPLASSETIFGAVVRDASGNTIADDIIAIKAKTDNLPVTVKKNVELAALPFFLKDSTDHVTPETGKSPTVTISKDGGSFNASSNSANEIANGWYEITITATEMNADTIIVKITATGSDQEGVVFLTDS